MVCDCHHELDVLAVTKCRFSLMGDSSHEDSRAHCCICSRPLMAQRDGSLRHTNSIAIAGIADMKGRVAAPNSVAIDPKRS